ncbi:VOC family protein [Micromonospora yasonensis]|uniref:VOC family protein n=1 Tax=Micromonospora yasonensis TaxID=1128667 RepID=UPI00222F3E24|nr:VOC family protein [Micromonospora yasonensis]MCW3840375.1 VOC family protein [Micromonospora yasonensis]
MSERTEYVDGAPAWVELSVTDLDAAKEFYGRLFGWEFKTDEDSERKYTYALHQGAKVAGLSQIPAGSGQPTVWATYLAAADLKSMVDGAVRRGATLLVPPFEVAGRGRAAVLRDPSGAVVGLWQAGAHIGAERINEINTTCWHEVLTNDAEAADAFYTGLFAMHRREIDDQTAILSINGERVGGRRKIGQNLQGVVPPHWQTYFWVADVDQAVERIRELGGKVRFGPVNTPHGPLAGVTDPFGAHFTVIFSTER